MKQGIPRQGQFWVKQKHSHVNPPRPLISEPPLLAPLCHPLQPEFTRFPAPGVHPVLLIF